VKEVDEKCSDNPSLLPTGSPSFGNNNLHCCESGGMSSIEAGQIASINDEFLYAPCLISGERAEETDAIIYDDRIGGSFGAEVGNVFRPLVMPVACNALPNIDGTSPAMVCGRLTSG
jgi:hypothetical protein